MPIRSNISRAFLAGFALLLGSGGCKVGSLPGEPSGSKPAFSSVESTGEDFLISTLDEVESIALDTRPHPGTLAGTPAAPPGGKNVLQATASDTIFVYGELTPDGHGAVVTERHTYPKGLLLITVRKSYGAAPARIVTQTKRYISFADFAADSAQQSNLTEVYGLSADTIVTHVLRNGILETYTFRLPVVTRVVNPQDGSVRITSRYGAAGTVRSEVRDGDGNLIQIRITSGQSDGSLVTYTEFADASWRNVRTVGRADGSVFREITSGP